MLPWYECKSFYVHVFHRMDRSTYKLIFIQQIWTEFHIETRVSTTHYEKVILRIYRNEVDFFYKTLLI